MRGVIFVAIVGLALAGCVSERPLHDLRANTNGPDEFSIQPAAPLEIPENLAALPQPTPGGTNRTDATPLSDAIVALGGRPSAANAGGIPANDAALVSQVARYGVNPAIRADLAAADAAFRKRRHVGGFLNVLGRDRYFRSYANQALDAYAELQRFRNLGVATPTAPPQ